MYAWGCDAADFVTSESATAQYLIGEFACICVRVRMCEGGSSVGVPAYKANSFVFFMSACANE